MICTQIHCVPYLLFAVRCEREREDSMASMASGILIKSGCDVHLDGVMTVGDDSCSSEDAISPAAKSSLSCQDRRTSFEHLVVDDKLCENTQVVHSCLLSDYF
jgi:hypothetical protein